MKFAENVRNNWKEVYCFNMTKPDPIHPEQARRELKNCSEKFKNIRLTVLQLYSIDLVPNDFRLFDPLETTFAANISLMKKRLKRRCVSV
jgi:hypothetical protein